MKRRSCLPAFLSFRMRTTCVPGRGCCLRRKSCGWPRARFGPASTTCCPAARCCNGRHIIRTSRCSPGGRRPYARIAIDDAETAGVGHVESPAGRAVGVGGGDRRAKPRTRRFTGLDALTPTERRVAPMATENLTNREIAQQIFAGVRTAEIHLSHTYPEARHPRTRGTLRSVGKRSITLRSQPRMGGLQDSQSIKDAGAGKEGQQPQAVPQ